jgi:probable rRNA maturation factor
MPTSGKAPERGPPSPVPSAAAPTYEVVIEDQGWRRLGDIDALIAAPLMALAHHEKSLAKGSVTIALSGDAKVQELNRTWRQQDKPTNVLSFPHPPAPGVPKTALHLGDVVLARETVLREAKELSIPVAHHLQHLVLHGVLHLLGYDHDQNEAAERMERLETEILAGIGIANPYAAVEH